MEKQELCAIAELHNLIQNWRDKYSTQWLSRSQDFKRFYQSVKLQQQTIALVFDHSVVPPKTVEEKLADAVFYVEDGCTYRVIYSMSEEGYFVGIDVDKEDGETHFDISSVPADAYFLGTHRL